MMLQKPKRNLLLLFLCIGVVLGIIFLVFSRGIFKPDIDFKRIQLHPVETYDKNILKHYNLKRLRLDDSIYIYSKSERATFNGDLLILGEQAGKQRLDFHPNLTGRYNAQFELLVLLKEKGKTIHLEIFREKKKFLEQTFTQNSFYSLTSELQLGKNDRFTIIAEGQGAVVFGSPVFYKKKPVDERTYVFLICADTLRADHLPTYGYPRETAPNIHDFSRDSVVFKKAYSQSPWTLPSHMSLFTSLYEYNHGIKQAGKLSPQVDFLVEELSQRFSNRSINGGGFVSTEFGFYRGFDLYKSYGRCGPRPDSAKTLFEKAIEDLKTFDFPRSFYFLHSYQIHTPYQPRHKFLAPFNPNPKHKKLMTPLHLNKKKISPEKVKKIKLPMIDLYDGEIRSFDHWFGVFIDFLKKERIYDRAMIIFTSDHGEEFHDHNKWGHSHSLYNEVIRVPLIIKFPKSRFKGISVEDKVGLIDIMPTILNFYHIDFNGGDKPGRLDGHDLIPVIKGKELKRPIISSITSGCYSPGHAYKIAIIEDQHKIICRIPYKKVKSFNSSSFSPLMGFEYYHLFTDPAEFNNLYLKQMYRVKKFRSLFESIIAKGLHNLKRKGKKVILDKKMQDALKALGYL